MLNQTATLTPSDIQTTSDFQSSQRCETTQRSDASTAPWAPSSSPPCPEAPRPSSAQLSGWKVYETSCVACHGTGVAFMARAAGAKWPDPDAKMLGQIKDEVIKRIEEMRRSGAKLP